MQTVREKKVGKLDLKAVGENLGPVAVMLCLTLFLQLLARLYLAGEFLLWPDAPTRSAALLDWQHLDQYTGWIGLIILLLAAPPKSSPRKSAANRFLHIAAACLLALGVATVTASVIGGEGGDFRGSLARAMTGFDLGICALLALAAATLCLEQLAAISDYFTKAGGVTIEQLWRLVTVQWTLAWAAAEIFLRLKYAWRGGISNIGSSIAIKSLLFYLPAFGMLPNLLMAISIRWLGQVRSAHPNAPKSKPRPRAWILALLFVNLGAVALTVGELGPKWMSAAGILGAIPLAFGVLMYAAGFGKNAWRGPKKLILIALAALVLGAFMCSAERFKSGQQIGLWREYSAAWHFFVSQGFAILWLMGIGGAFIQAFVSPKLQSHTAFHISASLMILGVFATAITLAFADILNQDWLSATFLGCTLLIMASLIASAVALRTWRSGRQNFDSAN